MLVRFLELKSRSSKVRGVAFGTTQAFVAEVRLRLDLHTVQSLISQASTDISSRRLRPQRRQSDRKWRATTSEIN